MEGGRDKFCCIIQYTRKAAGGLEGGGKGGHAYDIFPNGGGGVWSIKDGRKRGETRQKRETGRKEGFEAGAEAASIKMKAAEKDFFFFGLRPFFCAFSIFLVQRNKLAEKHYSEPAIKCLGGEKLSSPVTNARKIITQKCIFLVMFCW